MRLRNSLVYRVIAVVIALVCVGMFSVLAGCRRDLKESFYPTLADADKDGASTRGWIPAFLPASSHTIHEIHDLSPSTGWCAFEFLSNDSEGLRQMIKTVDALPPSVKRVSSPGVSWWPAELKGNLDADKIHEAGFEVYVVTRPETSVTTEVRLFAVDWQKGRGFFCTTRQ